MIQILCENVKGKIKFGNNILSISPPHFKSQPLQQFVFEVFSDLKATDGHVIIS
jgi:hypothetical protein